MINDVLKILALSVQCFVAGASRLVLGVVELKYLAA